MVQDERKTKKETVADYLWRGWLLNLSERERVDNVDQREKPSILHLVVGM